MSSPSLFGGTLLVIGNVIGAGILALPIAMAQLGFFYASLTLAFFWLLMMLGAYYFLEANLYLPNGSNLSSMARKSMGLPAVICVWIGNLLVLYSLIAAYVSGGGDLIRFALQPLISLSPLLYPLLFLLLFGFIVLKGIKTTDYTNRILMLLKGGVFALMLLALSKHADLRMLSFSWDISSKTISGSLLMVVLTSYGFATLVPSLRNYYHSDVLKLKKIIFLGTFIPFLCYLAWIGLLFAIIPLSGPHGLNAMAASSHPLSDLQTALNDKLHISWIVYGMYIFSGICVATSFLANSLSLTDFIADGFKRYDKSKQASKLTVYAIAYVPPLAAVLFYPKIFLLGLSIAGSLAIIQLLLLPGFILWIFRYVHQREGEDKPYEVMGAKPLLLGFIVLSALLLIIAIVFR